jgi:hypothetical protein
MRTDERAGNQKAGDRRQTELVKHEDYDRGHGIDHQKIAKNRVIAHPIWAPIQAWITYCCVSARSVP